MNQEEAKQYILERSTDYLQPDRSGKGFLCPICGSGSGKKGTGITTKDGIHFTCWAGCYTNSDIIDIIGQQYGLTNYIDKLQKAAEAFHITIGGAEYQNHAKNEQHTHNSIHTNAYTQQQTEPEPEPEADYTSFYREANKRLNETEYLQRRGISQEVADRFMLGYVAAWRHPKAPPTVPISPRLIIPTSANSYLARDIRRDLTEEQYKYRIGKVGKVRIFNTNALQEAKQPIFIVEGEIDALSVIEAGGEAVALGSVANRRILLELLEEQKPAQPLIIAMDNDEAGEKAAQELTDGLERLKIPFYRVNPFGKYKDANEALLADRDIFTLNIKDPEGTERREHFKNSAAYYLQDFIDGIKDSVNTPYIPTGFNNLDEALDGGLYEGLYIIGAISALGKTTLILQIADQIAQSGQDVLIISLEMARTELMAKSISRHTIIEVLTAGGNTQHAKTTRGITTGKRYQEYCKTEHELIKTAIEQYSIYAKHIYVIEGVGDIGAQQVREAVNRHTTITGKAPVVIIDYLQILAPYNERATDKQNTDKAVIELKRISRDYKTPVIGISSFNRENYREAVSMKAFKESGAVEYSSDVLIGLQYHGAGKKDFNEEEASKQEPREIELVILKNRNGKAWVRVPFKYYPLFNYFAEAEKAKGGIRV